MLTVQNGHSSCVLYGYKSTEHIGQSWAVTLPPHPYMVLAFLEPDLAILLICAPVSLRSKPLFPCFPPPQKKLAFPKALYAWSTVCKCTCLYVNTRLCRYKCVHLPTKARGQHWVSSLINTHLIFEARSFTEAFTDSAVSKSQGPSCLHLSGAGITGTQHHMDVGVLNVGPYVCAVRTIRTKLSPPKLSCS